MCKEQVRLFKWRYIINGNENKTDENRLHIYDINRPRPRHGGKYTKHKMCLTTVMVTYIKQHLSKIWSSIHEN